MSNILYAYTKLVFCMLVSNSFKYNSSNIFSTRQNNDWIYKNDPVQKLTYPLILILDVIPWMTIFLFCDSCSWVLCWSRADCCSFFGFPASSAYLTPFQKWLYDFEIYLSHWDNWGTHATITKGEHFYWRSRRQHDALRGRSCKLFESDKQGKLCLFWLLGNMQIFM